MRETFRQHLRFERQRQQGEGLEAAILVIGLEQALERQQRCEQRRHPDNARRNALQQLGLRSDAEREQHHGQHEERDHHRGIAALAERQTEIARDQA